MRFSGLVRWRRSIALASLVAGASGMADGADAQTTPRGPVSGSRAASLVIRNATIVDGNGTPASGPADIVVRGNRITDVVWLDPVALKSGTAKRPSGDTEIDATGLIAFDQQIRFRLPAAARPGHLHALLLALERLEAGERSNVAYPLHRLAEALVKRSLVVLISDLIDDPAPVIKGLRHLKFRGTDVVVFQVLDPDELTFPFKGAARFKDIETAEEVVADSARARTDYLRQLAELTQRYDRELRGAGIDYVQLDTSQPLDFALLTYLSARARRK